MSLPVVLDQINLELFIKCLDILNILNILHCRVFRVLASRKQSSSCDGL